MCPRVHLSSKKPSFRAKVWRLGKNCYGRILNDTRKVGAGNNTPVDMVVYPTIYKVLYIPGGAGFLPSTVPTPSNGWCLNPRGLLIMVPFPIHLAPLGGYASCIMFLHFSIFDIS